MRQWIKINASDHVAVALVPLNAGEEIKVDPHTILRLEESIPQGHKFALFDISPHTPVIKYGAPIGESTKFIKKGQWVHTHNVKTLLNDTLSYEYTPEKIKTDLSVPAENTHTFLGYRRPNGKVGVRNELWIIPTVGCVNSVVKEMEQAAKQRFFHDRSGNTTMDTSVDDIIAFNHPYGCSQMGDDQKHTLLVLADMINHPNAGAVLVVGLGCENCQIDLLKTYLGEIDEDRVHFLICQETEDEIESAMTSISKLLTYAGQFSRRPCPASDLVIGMKCGGSDGLSGITANPLVGLFSDRLIGEGGTTILTEVPEMFGAETLLMNRCADRSVFDKTVCLINDFKQYFKSHGQTIYENPSPGNKQGGISTLEDKSLGCTQKSGHAPVVDVLRYGQTVEKTGLHLLSAPGNDLIASTALAIAGAQIVLFTTGRGTPFASLVPTIKISSNTGLAHRKNRWIDFNAGRIADGEQPDEVADRLFDYILRVASGEKVKSEEAGYHDIAIFKQGVTL